MIEGGWSDGQIIFQPEWRVPRTPSQASRREAGHSFDGYPSDIVIFESDETAGEWEHLLILFELKAPNHQEGRNQLEILLSLEPRARMGFWTNGTNTLALYRRADGTFESVAEAPLPRADDNLSLPAVKPLVWGDLEEVGRKTLQDKLERVFGSIVARDTRSTRSDERLNHLCNLLLVKLESDKRAKAQQSSAVVFQPRETEHGTAAAMREAYLDLRRTQLEIFSGSTDSELRLDDHSIHEVVYELANLRLVDVSAETIAQAFQVFRSTNLKAGEGQYFTPHRVIASAVALMDINYDDKVVDPACGTGGFLVEAYLSLGRNSPGLSDADLRSWAHRRLYGVDKDDISVKLTRAIMQITGDGSANVYVGDSIREHAWPIDYPSLVDPLKDEQFTCVITNPPFGRDLKVDKRDARRSGYTISAAASSRTGEYKDLELGLVFLERAWRLLAVGGRLGIILPETYFFSTTYAWLQHWLDSRFILRGMLNIPMEAFQGFCRAKTNFYVFEKKDLLDA
ncbi:MAG: SAM-dependent DNA methyltransferase [Acidimicrobiia bacterium]|nr:SAM-dependent DNA methyltransferase [Acidimicrobiia bacterium]